jgi:lactoylglutathione lyase
MQTELAENLIEDFERGRLSRRQLVARLMGLGAALATSGRIGWAQGTSAPVAARPTFQAQGLNHIALDVTDVVRSREFYGKHLGLHLIRGDDRAAFLGADRDFFLTLFRAERPGLNHYCYTIEKYDADEVMQRLADAGLRPRREGDRVYFPDPDGLTVQLAGRRN